MSAHAACLWVLLEGEWTKDYLNARHRQWWRYPRGLSHRAALCREVVYESLDYGPNMPKDDCPF